MGNSLISLENFDLEIKSSIKLISNISFSVDKKRRIGITGPSGCGKTTLLRYVLQNHSGRINSNGLSINKEKLVAFMPQSNGLLPWFSLLKNLEVFAHDKIDINGILDNLGLSDKKHTFPVQLSGGEYQRGLLALAIASKPDLFIVDEPLTQLDLGNKWKILKYWSSKIDEFDSALFLVSHDIETLIYLCDEIIVFTDKPSNIKGKVEILEAHPRNDEFIVSKNYIDCKTKLVNLIKQ